MTLHHHWVAHKESTCCDPCWVLTVSREHWCFDSPRITTESQSSKELGRGWSCMDDLSICHLKCEKPNLSHVFQ